MSWQDGRYHPGSVPASGPGPGSDIRGEFPPSLYYAPLQYQVQYQHQQPWHTPYPAPSSTTHGNHPQPPYALGVASPLSVQPLPPYTASSTPSASRTPSIPSVSKPPVMSSSRITIVPPPRASATNSAPTTASALSPVPHATSNEKSRKRKRAEKTESKQKHVNPAIPLSRVNELPRGTQKNPFEIDSSPEPDTKSFVHKTPNIAKHYPSAGTRPNGLVTKESDHYGSTFGNLSTSRVDLNSPLVQAKSFSSSKKQHGAQTDAFNYNHDNHMVSPEIAYHQSSSYGPAPNDRTPSYAHDGYQIASFDYIIDIPVPSAYYAPPQEQLPEPREYPISPPAHTVYGPPQPPMAALGPSAPVQGASISDYEPVLSAEQQRIVDLILEGNNVFYTGSAGCGKSTILKAFVKRFATQVPPKRVRIIAPTNLAALNVQGTTTWNYAGWTPDSFKKPLAVLKKAASGEQVYERFNTTDVLVIDEISMVENHHFERLNEIMKAALGQKNGGGPFGGVQIIVTGDFCQLSPVKPFRYCIGCGWELVPDNPKGPRTYQCENRRCHEDVFEDIDKWAFRSKAWADCDFKHVNLTEIHRQHDKKFISILQKIRTDGVILPNHGRILLNHASDTEGAIKLFARRDDVDRVNNENISKIESKAQIYKCGDDFNWKLHHRDDTSLEKNTRLAEDGSGTLHYLKDHRYEIFVTLKQGMRVVLQSNLDPSAGLVNGSQGTIVDFEPFDQKKLPKKADNRKEMEMSMTPNLRGSHAAYAEERIKIFADDNKRQSWPIVKFDNGLERTIFADCTSSELGNEEPYSLLSRTQIPLMAGYAITVHKSQGMTLDRVIVDLGRAFEPSQLYVALSRARSLSGLKVVSLPQRPLGGANPQVKEFFDTYLKKGAVVPVVAINHVA